ncbi:hypothetical protein ALC62_03099 [Cyphomyrmex costatus]|uniref:Uncharacterized protein n=1 Tax=Cyphomyrmex costatus TaxID=456900 RepID=A0A151IM84_9HYME|nr:hypothetical protein ALC62_03099 [Cyphomyrmex costatus]
MKLMLSQIVTHTRSPFYNLVLFLHYLTLLIIYYICILTGSTSHIITDISLEPVASLRPSGENLQYQTSSQ